MRPRKLHLRKDALTELSETQLAEVAGGVQTLQSGCQSGVAPCYPETIRNCFTHTTSLDCEPTEICPTNGCG